MSHKRNVLLELGICWSSGPKATRTYGVALWAYPGVMIPICEGLKSRKEAGLVLKKFMADFESAYSPKSIEEVILSPLLRDLFKMFQRLDWLKAEGQQEP